jgi:hypothetical protein
MNIRIIILLLLFTFNLSSSELGEDSTKIFGVTIDDISNLDEIVKSLEKLPVKPTVRIVFDEWIPAEQYVEAVNRIGKVSYIMGELLDSYYMKDYSNEQYRDRVKNYLDVLGNKVDIWEIGNEINGEWLGNSSDVREKVKTAYTLVKEKKMKTALTLYYNKDCWEKPENEMFAWVNRYIPDDIKNNLDYVFVSYYEDDCNDFQPEWQNVFDSLHVIFPNSFLGVGECGTKYPDKKAKYMKRYYSMNTKTPNYVGGYFWWYFKQDCVPYTKDLWKIIYSLINKHK